jgi:hypothetical protein
MARSSTAQSRAPIAPPERERRTGQEACPTGVIARSRKEFENRGAAEAPLGQAELERGAQHAQPVDGAAAEIDGGGFREITGGTGDLAYPRAHQHGLRHYLVIEYEIVGIALQRHGLQQLPAVGPKAGVILGELGAHEQVLHQRQETIGDVLIDRHAAA